MKKSEAAAALATVLKRLDNIRYYYTDPKFADALHILDYLDLIGIKPSKYWGDKKTKKAIRYPDSASNKNEEFLEGWEPEGE